MVPQTAFLVFGATLFLIGAVGALVRRNAIVVLMSIELMLNGINVTFVTFAYFLGDATGQLFALFIITVAAAEAAVGLAIFLALFRLKPTVNVDEVNILKW